MSHHFIHQNNFIGNGLYASQAYDNGTNNQWYNETTMEGNYWSDHNETGSYLIAGSAGALDPCPSLLVFINPKTDKTNTNSFSFLFIRIVLFFIVIGLLGGGGGVSKRKKSA
ncbi:MAG: hypothetical protein ACFE9L_10535 [Candidatus Hodarchaeota archaeon]